MNNEIKDKVRELLLKNAYITNEFEMDDPFRIYSELAFRLKINNNYYGIDAVIEEIAEQYSPKELEKEKEFLSKISDMFGDMFDDEDVEPEPEQIDIAEKIAEKVQLKLATQIKYMVGILLMKEAPGMGVPYYEVIAASLAIVHKVTIHGCVIPTYDRLIHIILSACEDDKYNDMRSKLNERKEQWKRAESIGYEF